MFDSRIWQDYTEAGLIFEKIEMPYSPKYHRQSTRLKDYDYSQAGAYFVTICTRERECLFGEVVGDEIRVSEVGGVVIQCWVGIPVHFPNVELDEYVVMPNHVHGILVLGSARVGAQHVAPLQVPADVSVRARPEHAINVTPGSLGAIVRAFKAAVTRRAHELQSERGWPIWQRNYYEHVIRNDDELNKIRRYIQNNPLKWALDRDNPMNRQPTADSSEAYLREAADEN